MLKSLIVKNFAIIDNIQVDFDDHMTVITGETGAGKSLIIDAIGLLFGNRASNDMIRFGESKALIEGVFDNLSNEVYTTLDNLEIEYNKDEFLIIKREIYENGKSICKVNNTNITLSNLIELSSFIGNIHTQFDTQKILDQKNYFHFIDDNDIEILLLEYKKNLSEYNTILKKYKNLIDKENENIQKLDFLKYQIKELSNAKLSILEEQELKEKINVLNNYEKIVSSTQEFIDNFENNSIIRNLYQSITSLNKISSYDKVYEESKQKLLDIYYNLNDIYEEVYSSISKNNLDISEIDEINSRLGLYSDLKRKYKMTTEELISFFEKIKIEVENIENFDSIKKDLEKELMLSYNKTLNIANNISDKRKINANEIERGIEENLKDLELKNTIFKIEFSNSKEITFKKDGIDEVSFLITFNKGEPLKLLSKVASGGELSRFMLAFKANIANKFIDQTLIFDEIDNGVSGTIAYSIANKIKKISSNCQILCVTHLPQVAAIADYHMHISKEVMTNDRTITKIEQLSYDDRITEIAKMISNKEITISSINLAKELINKK